MTSPRVSFVRLPRLAGGVRKESVGILRMLKQSPDSIIRVAEAHQSNTASGIGRIITSQQCFRIRYDNVPLVRIFGTKDLDRQSLIVPGRAQTIMADVIHAVVIGTQPKCQAIKRDFCLSGQNVDMRPQTLKT